MNVIPLHPRGYCASCKRAILAGDTTFGPQTPDGEVQIHVDCMANGKRRAPESGEDAQVTRLPVRDNSQHETPDIA